MDITQKRSLLGVLLLLETVIFVALSSNVSPHNKNGICLFFWWVTIPAFTVSLINIHNEFKVIGPVVCSGVSSLLWSYWFIIQNSSLKHISDDASAVLPVLYVFVIGACIGAVCVLFVRCVVNSIRKSDKVGILHSSITGMKKGLVLSFLCTAISLPFILSMGPQGSAQQLNPLLQHIQIHYTTRLSIVLLIVGSAYGASVGALSGLAYSYNQSQIRCFHRKAQNG